MELYKRISMKDMLAQALYLLMEEMPFEKITIKQIGVKAGVIRGTFYNHFYDKYEALEYLTYTLLVGSIEEDNFRIRLKRILEVFQTQKEFFKKCFQVEGQNSFDMMLSHILAEILMNYLEVEEVDFQKSSMSSKDFTEIHANMIVYVLKNWILKKDNLNYEVIYEQLLQLLGKGAKGMIDELKEIGSPTNSVDTQIVGN